jgi:hypothetical protein
MGKSVRNPWVYRLNLDARPVLPGTQPENRQNAQFIVEIFPFFGLFDFGTVHRSVHAVRARLARFVSGLQGLGTSAQGLVVLF